MTCNQMSKELTILKQQEHLKWLKEPDKYALQNSLKNLESAYENYFREIKKGNKNQGFPKFKSKKDNCKTYRTTRSYRKESNTYNINIKNNKIQLPKLNWMKFKNSREIKGKILNVTIKQIPSGKYYIYVCCEINIIQKVTTILNNKIGIDLGIKEFAILSNGKKVNNPKYQKKYEQKLKNQQKILSRKQKGSNNRNKQRIKVAKIYEKINNCKLDFLHKLSSKLINENQIICLEDLKISKMLQTKNSNKIMNKNINNVSWNKFTMQLQYKTDWYGVIIQKVNQYFPSSQLCSDCGFKNIQIKDLSIREWICPNCGEIHDRDINAATNILNEGLRLLNI